MGSTHSKHSTASRDPHHDLADRTAVRLNARQPNDQDADRMAAAVPNGKEPLFIVFKKDNEGMYAYDEEYYARFQEHRLRRPSGEWARERDRQRRRGEREGKQDGGGDGQKNEQRLPAGLRNAQGGEPVYAPADGGKEHTPWVQNDVSRGPGRRLGQGGSSNLHESTKGDIKVDNSRQAFVHRKR